MKFYLHFSIFIGSILLFPISNWWISYSVQLEEVCDNGMDDDLDGLIDLNDPDCDCPVIEPISLVPNPSFEEKSCCPENRSELNCAETWIQASEPTTDYIHTCGWLGWDDFPVPTPIPDGNGVIGFRDGRARMGESDPTWKEYAGACLLGPLRTGVSYRFEFWVGFAAQQHSPPINIHFFGTPDCEFLPFGVGNEQFGCPTNGPNWVLLGTKAVAGGNNWVKASIDVTPTQDINAIAIGPSCNNRNSSVSLYYFLDDLVLDEQAAFDFTIKTNGGNPCTNDFALQVPHFDSLNYQWYREGIALIGETESTLSPNQVEGQYQVRVTNSVDCKVTTVYPYVKPSFETKVDLVICDGDTHAFGNAALTTSGIYERTIKTEGNCDSTIILDLAVASNKADTLAIKIFRSESYEVGPYTYGTEGDHLSPLLSSYGCDSLVLLQLEFYEVYAPNVFSPNDDGVNDSFTIMGGDDLISITSLQIFDRWGGLVFEGREMTPGDPFQAWDGLKNGDYHPEGVYVFSALLLMDDGKERRYSGSLALMR